MALKRKFSDEERYGLTQEEIRMAEKYLRKHKTAGVIPETEALKLFELYLIGQTFSEISKQFPQYPLERILMTAAQKQWAKDRDKMQHTLRDRVKAKVVKSVIEQVDFLTSMLSVSNAEHLSDMQKYIMDPINNPKPEMRIGSIKEYKEVAETLYKLVAGATSNQPTKTSPLFDALGNKQNITTPDPQEDNKKLNKPKDVAELMAELADQTELARGEE
jgi:hypothetical protein